jgi:DNA-binding MarR family transcriptional regulator
MWEASPVEEFIFDFIDKFKPLFFPEKWSNTFLDYSKNEIMALIFVYRKGSATMTEIAEYIGVPLNTATGIISRLEKRKVISRQRDLLDKRVVTVSLTSEGIKFIRNELKTISHYYNKLMDSVTDEEKLLLLKLGSKLIELMLEELPVNKTKDMNKKVRKIIIE